ncbi:TMV resistance protein N-like protein [Tanacetum coccineum]
MQQFLPNLRYIKICDLHYLITTPDVTGLPNLERFYISSCDSLEEIHSSIGRSESLVYLHITSCKNLVIVPPITRSNKLETLLIENNTKLFNVSEIRREEVASDKDCCTNRFVSYLTCCYSNLGEPDEAEVDEQFSSGEPSLRHNICYISSHKRLTSLSLIECKLGDDDLGSVVGELPNLQKLDLTRNYFSRIDFRLLKLPRLKYLRVSGCWNLVELLQLPSSIAVLIAESCRWLESIGDISNCKWLWKVSLVRRVSSPVFKIPDFISEVRLYLLVFSPYINQKSSII